MSSDAEQIRLVARAVSGLAGRARRAGLDVTGAGHARWESQGAQAFRDRLEERHRELGSRAEDLDELSRALMSHAHQVEVREAFILKAILVLEQTGGTVINDARDVAGELQKTAHNAGTVALHGSKNILDNMNPLTSMRHVR